MVHYAGSTSKTLDALCAEELSYSHSDAHIEDKATDLGQERDTTPARTFGVREIVVRCRTAATKPLGAGRLRVMTLQFGCFDPVATTGFDRGCVKTQLPPTAAQ